MLSAVFVPAVFNFLLYFVLFSTVCPAERSSNYFITNSLLVSTDTFVMFVRIPDGLTAEDRILAVLEFYLTSFHAGRKVRSSLFYLYTSRGRKVGV